MKLVESYKTDESFLYEKTYLFIKGYATALGLSQTLRALPLARKFHDGQYRKGEILIDGKSYRLPYVLHVLKVCSTLISLHLPLTSVELEPFNGGTKFRNGDTLMARITPCLENGKTAKVKILEDEEIGFGSTEYIILRAKNKLDEDFVYYLSRYSSVREPAIKSMVGTSGRQRVQLDVVKNLELLVPPLNERIKIGKILSSLDDKIELNQSINENLT